MVRAVVDLSPLQSFGDDLARAPRGDPLLARDLVIGPALAQPGKNPLPTIIQTEHVFAFNAMGHTTPWPRPLKGLRERHGGRTRGVRFKAMRSKVRRIWNG